MFNLFKKKEVSPADNTPGGIVGAVLKVFDKNEKEVSLLRPVVAQIAALGPELKKLSDEELKERSAQLRQRFKDEVTARLQKSRDPQSGEQHQRNVTVKIPAGVREGARVRAAKQGAPGQNGGPNGDLFLKIHIEPHAFWKREGDNIHCEVPVTFAEAALGATVEVPTINGPVKMKVPAGTQSGQTFRLSGRGVKHLKGGGHGDQFVKVKVDVPKKLNPREAELVRELAQLRAQNVRLGLPTEL